MKRLCYAVVIWVAGVCSLMAQQKFASTVGLEVKSTGSGKTTVHHWETDWGSYDRDHKTSRDLDVNVRNVSAQPAGKLQIDVFWLTKDYRTNFIRIHSRESFVIDALDVNGYSHSFACPPVSSNVVNYATTGQRIETGERMYGWVVEVSRDGEVIAGKAASEEQERLALDPARWGKLTQSFGVGHQGPGSAEVPRPKAGTRHF